MGQNGKTKKYSTNESFEAETETESVHESNDEQPKQQKSKKQEKKRKKQEERNNKIEKVKSKIKHHHIV